MGYAFCSVSAQRMVKFPLSFVAFTELSKLCDRTQAWLIIRKRLPAKILSNLYSLLIKVLTRLKEIHCINCLTSFSTRQSFQVSRDISRLMTSHNVFLQMGNIYTPKF